MRVLVVEDDQDVAEVMAIGLRSHGMSVDIAGDGASALRLAQEFAYDVVVLDRGLPDMSGDDVSRQLNVAASESKVLMVSGRATLQDKLEGFEAGADGYLTKPFARVELAARVEALGRWRARAAPAVYEVGGVLLDPNHRDVLRHGVPIRLSHKEFAVLNTLMAAEGAVVSTQALLTMGWGDSNKASAASALRVTIAHLRQKLGDPPIVLTVHGTGYKVAK